MNRPSTQGGNWSWRLKSDYARGSEADELAELVTIFDRFPRPKPVGAQFVERNGVSRTVRFFCPLVHLEEVSEGFAPCGDWFHGETVFGQSE